MTMPVTTPMPNDMAKIFSQNCERFRKTGRLVSANAPSRKAMNGKADRECRKKNVPANHPSELDARKNFRIKTHRPASPRRLTQPAFLTSLPRVFRGGLYTNKFVAAMTFGRVRQAD